MSTKATITKFTGRKAQFLNMSEDGKKIRSVKFKNKNKYDRKDRSWERD